MGSVFLIVPNWDNQQNMVKLFRKNTVAVTSQTTKTTRAEEAVSRKIAPIHFVFMHLLYNQHHPDRARKAAQATIRILDFECPVVIVKDYAN